MNGMKWHLNVVKTCHIFIKCMLVTCKRPQQFANTHLKKKKKITLNVNFEKSFLMVKWFCPDLFWCSKHWYDLNILITLVGSVSQFTSYYLPEHGGMSMLPYCG